MAKRQPQTSQWQNSPVHDCACGRTACDALTTALRLATHAAQQQRRMAKAASTANKRWLWPEGPTQKLQSMYCCETLLHEKITRSTPPAIVQFGADVCRPAIGESGGPCCIAPAATAPAGGDGAACAAVPAAAPAPTLLPPGRCPSIGVTAAPLGVTAIGVRMNGRAGAGVCAPVDGVAATPTPLPPGVATGALPAPTLAPAAGC